MNEPLKFDQFAVYQVDYKESEFKSMSFNLQNKENNQKWGPIKVDLTNPKEKYDLGTGYSLELLSYFPDFILMRMENQIRKRNYQTILHLYLKCLHLKHQMVK